SKRPKFTPPSGLERKDDHNPQPDFRKAVSEKSGSTPDSVQNKQRLKCTESTLDRVQNELSSKRTESILDSVQKRQSTDQTETKTNSVHDDPSNKSTGFKTDPEKPKEDPNWTESRSN